ncbi:helix-turn-helix domain-containing protein, partial [Acidocella sp. KAb 2-4]|uniref:helix-turn-helix domain-containing protein n=1 Tax=Acidocella sp. KAb 2-4 TaxID=2885158 RepID=UPI001D07490B
FQSPLETKGPPMTSETAHTATIPNAVAFSGLSRSEVYRLLAAGKLRAVKSNKRTLIRMDSLRAYLDSLPAATFRAPDAA